MSKVGVELMFSMMFNMGTSRSIHTLSSNFENLKGANENMIQYYTLTLEKYNTSATWQWNIETFIRCNT